MRRERGGPRPEQRIDGATGSNRDTEKISCFSIVNASAAVLATIAGRFCQRLCHTEAFSPHACETLRLPGEDSSISARMACRSSEAEMTGNSRTRAQPRAQMKTSGRTARPSVRLPEPDEENRRRHNNHPGANKDSQQRLRKSSITAAALERTRFGAAELLQVNNINQVSTKPASDLRVRHRDSLIPALRINTSSRHRPATAGDNPSR
jgi:hypothetical protein